MRFSLILLALFVTALAAGCGSSAADADPYDTLQLCFDDHHTNESLGIKESIVICCLDHPIGASMQHPSCGNTQAECETHVNAELLDTSATTVEVTTACVDYVTKKGM
jgi:hypothetical protein